MIILGIETSCDETAAAILEKNSQGEIKILSNIVASSASLQQKFGGIIPEQAAREQLKSIIPVIKEALLQAFPDTPTSPHQPPPIDAIAVTQGPGLIGSLLVGVETAKILSTIYKKPLIPVNHLIGHFYANWVENSPVFPCIGLLVSGGHTDLVLFEDHGKFKYLGGTRDDAAGECFDKCARLLNLPYPGGPQISKLAQSGNPKSFDLPRPMIHSKDFDFSYSGLKTAVSNLLLSEAKSETQKVIGEQVLQMPGNLRTNSEGFDPNGTFESDELSNICSSIEQAIIDPLVIKTLKAAKKYKVNQIIVAGGVAANQKLKESLQLTITNEQLPIKLSVPPPILCTDNAAMIASAAFFLTPTKDPINLQANPNLSLAY